MRKIGFSITYKDELSARQTLKMLEDHHVVISKAKLFIRENQNDTKFFNRLRPKIFLMMLVNGLVGGILGAIIFILLWMGWSILFDRLELWKIITLGIISGGATGMILGTALSIISKESAVPISIEDIENETIVLDFDVSSAEREKVKKILQDSGADKILED